MKRIFSVVAVVMAMVVASPQVNAQVSDKQITKLAKKKVKEYVKEGWTETPGALPLQSQLEESYRMQYTKNDVGEDKYIIMTSQAIGQHYNAAKLQAIEQGKLLLAGQLLSEITGLVDNTLANQGMEPEEAQSISQTVAESSNVISSSLGRVITVVECHRKLPNKNTEVLVTIAYDATKGNQKAKQAVLQELSKKSEALRGKLDKLLKLNE